MLAKLSFRNAKRQTGDYLVYFITITLAAALIYAFNNLLLSQEMKNLSTVLDNTAFIVTVASIAVVGILGWLVYYTQRFMLHKRSREFATYILLGVEKKQVSKMFVNENMAVGVAALLLGLLAGNLIYQGLRAVVMNLFGLPYAFSFSFSFATAALTTLYFAFIFIVSTLLCRMLIRRMSIRDLMEMDKQNEEEMIEKSKSRKKMFIVSIICGIIGIALLLTRNLFLGTTGCLLLVFFSYGFFISFSSGVPAFFEKRPEKKYKGSTLLIFRSLSSKLASMGVTLGTIALIFTATLLTEGSGLLFQNMFEEQERQITAFDLFISASVEDSDMSFYEEYIAENLDVTAQRRYTTYNTGNDQLMQYIKNNTRFHSYFEEDQVMRFSDYAAVRAVLGYTPVELGEGEYLLHSLEHLKPVLENYTETIKMGQTTLSPGKVYNEVLTQYSWGGNGSGFIIVVPDEAAEALVPSLDIWCMVTSELVDGKIYEGITDIRDKRSNENVESAQYYAILSKGASKQSFASTSAMIVFPLFYVSLVLIMVAATILTIQFLSDAKKLKRQYAILADLGMDKKELHRALNRHLLIYFSMPVLPPVLICMIFMFALGNAFDPGVIASTAHLWGIIGVTLGLFFAIYLLYTLATGSSAKKSVLPR